MAAEGATVRSASADDLHFVVKPLRDAVTALAAPHPRIFRLPILQGVCESFQTFKTTVFEFTCEPNERFRILHELESLLISFKNKPAHLVPFVTNRTHRWAGIERPLKFMGLKTIQILRVHAKQFSKSALPLCQRIELVPHFLKVLKHCSDNVKLYRPICGASLPKLCMRL
jgi:hypothetical protein